jgi:hypothetical protein
MVMFGSPLALRLAPLLLLALLMQALLVALGKLAVSRQQAQPLALWLAVDCLLHQQRILNTI